MWLSPQIPFHDVARAAPLAPTPPKQRDPDMVVCHRLVSLAPGSIYRFSSTGSGRPSDRATRLAALSPLVMDPSTP